MHRIALMLGVIILAAASFGCSAWFLWRWFDGGAAGAVAAAVGIGVQLFGYALPLTGAACWHRHPRRALAAMGLAVAPLALSVAATIGTLEHAASSGHQQALATSAAHQHRMATLQSLQQQISALTHSAQRAVAVDYRTQAAQHLAQARDLQAQRQQVLADLEALQPATPSALGALLQTLAGAAPWISPEGLQRAMVVLLALLFDALPVLGLVLLSATPADNARQHAQQQDAARQQQVKPKPARVVAKAPPTPAPRPVPKAAPSAQPDDLTQRVGAALRAGDIPPTFRAVASFAGIGNRRVRDIFAELANQGTIERSGNGWKVNHD